MTSLSASLLIGWLGKRLYHVISIILLFSVFTTLLTFKHGMKPREYRGIINLQTRNTSRAWTAELPRDWTGIRRHDTDIDCYHGYTGSEVTTDVMKNRSDRAIRVCAAAGLTGHRRLADLPMFANILVNDELKIIYCRVPHVSSSTWMKTFVYAKGVLPRQFDLYRPSYLAAFGFRRLGEYKTKEITERLNSYFKFLFVRDPLERLISAYKYLFNPKIANNKNVIYRRRLARLMSRKFPNVSANLENTGNISFDNYVSFLALTIHAKSQLDSHVSRISQVCLPCLIRYDAIGKLDTFRDDATYILRKIYPNSCYETLRSDSFNKSLPRTTQSVVEAFMKNVPQNVRKILQSHFAFEKKIFGL